MLQRLHYFLLSFLHCSFFLPLQLKPSVLKFLLFKLGLLFTRLGFSVLSTFLGYFVLLEAYLWFGHVVLAPAVVQCCFAKAIIFFYFLFFNVFYLLLDLFRAIDLDLLEFSQTVLCLSQHILFFRLLRLFIQTHKDIPLLHCVWVIFTSNPYLYFTARFKIKVLSGQQYFISCSAQAR